MKSAVAAIGVWLVAIAPHATVAGERIVVSPSGPQRSVAEAVRRAPAGSTIVIRAGTYREPQIVVDRPLTIVGEGRPKIEA
jgi:nitrous oxidase accessory protein